MDEGATLIGRAEITPDTKTARSIPPRPETAAPAPQKA
jgi:hypothetical protein